VVTVARLTVLGAVEGLVDEAVLMRLMAHVGATPSAVYGKRGKPYIRQQLAGYNNAARFSSWIVLVDLNAEAECAPVLVETWLPDPAPHMCFRVAVHKIEAWILADAERLSRFLSVSPALIPTKPDAEPDPKRTLVEVARKSRRRAICQDMVPRPGSGRAVGPAYSSRLIEFALDEAEGWRPEIAAQRSDSLRRCIEGIGRLVGEGRASP